MAGFEWPLRTLDLSSISSLLIRQGWVNSGGKAGLYERYRLPSKKEKADSQSVLLPLDRSREDFDDLLAELLVRLEQLTPGGVQALRKALTETSLGDELKFRKDVTTVAGAVAWSAGKDLIVAAEGILLAGAKARLSRRAYYGQVNGRFAHRFLDSVLMGQTEIGSYVVTAFAPVHETFPDKAPKPEAPSLGGVGTYTGREIVESVIGGLEATVEALDHYWSTNSMSGFARGVEAGISKEMVESVRRMVIDSDGADVTIEWSSEVSQVESQPAPTRLAFEGSAAPILESARYHLASLQPSEYVTAVGRLSLVSRPKRGEVGVVRLKVRDGSNAPTLQIRLNDEAFEVAATAIAREQDVEVSGRQERDGNRYWLYDANLSIVAETDAGKPLFP